MDRGEKNKVPTLNTDIFVLMGRWNRVEEIKKKRRVFKKNYKFVTRGRYKKYHSSRIRSVSLLYEMMFIINMLAEARGEETRCTKKKKE